MGQATPFKPIALVVEDDALQREYAVVLLKECEMGVVECNSAEAALRVLDRIGACVSLMFTDVNLAGAIDGLELARFAKTNFPNIHVIVTSGTPRAGLPDGAKFLAKPWRALDVLREAERSMAT
ncbi:MAG: response regulator [Xanthobacteraceae bacterium]|nr:response regulator [Xanthobacteraceae bacterium]